MQRSLCLTGSCLHHPSSWRSKSSIIRPIRTLFTTTPHSQASTHPTPTWWKGPTRLALDQAAATRLPELYRQLLSPGHASSSSSNNANTALDETPTQSVINHYEEWITTARLNDIPPSTRAALEALYLTALGRAGQVDKLTSVLQELKTTRPNSPSSPFNSHISTTAPSPDSTTLYNVTTPRSSSSSHRAKSSSSSFRPATPFHSSPSPNPSFPSGPLQVTVSEAWSWAKLTRTIVSRVIIGMLLLTGASVFLDTQGIIRNVSPGGSELETYPTVRFDDVQGVDEAKSELEEIVAFLKNPKKFSSLGGRLPKGVLLYGPPGTGKTFLARAVAGEAGVPFFQMSGSEFDELYVGLGAKRVRELFANAKKRAPCIVFIDEIDAVGSKRNSKDQSYMRQTLNQLLTELDGFNPNDGVIFICATNTPESLDKALLRPGRIDSQIPVPLPDISGRLKILQSHMKKVAFDKDINALTLARGTPGFSGADLANVVNQAALKASKEQSKLVKMAHLEWAKDKIIMGTERKSAIITADEKKLTAYHEAGHTLVALHTPNTMPLHKVSVIPRGRALGVTVQLPDKEMHTASRAELYARLDVCMGGRVAEELIFGHDAVTTGASNDLEQATHTALNMVRRYGMSEKAGLLGLDDDLFQFLSEHGKQVIESEVKQMLKEANERVIFLLRAKRLELDRLAEALIEFETLDEDEVRRVVRGERLARTLSSS